jgi:hypothetical protein
MEGGWDAAQVYAVPQRLQAPGAADAAPGELMQRSEVFEQTARFVRDFRVGTLHVYREKLLNNAQEGRFHLEIDLEHLKNYSEELHDAITHMPGQYLWHVSEARRATAAHTHSAPSPSRPAHWPRFSSPAPPPPLSPPSPRWKRAPATFS